MGENDFSTNVNQGKKKFSKKLKFLLILAIFLTGLLVTVGFAGLYEMLEKELWKSEDITGTAYELITYLINFTIFISLLRIYASKQFFIHSLSNYFFVIGWIIIGTSFAITHFPTYSSNGFVIMQFGSFVLIDGKLFVFGILFLVLGSLIKEGIEMQKEMDEIL